VLDLKADSLIGRPTIARPGISLCPVALPVLLLASLLTGCASRPGVGALLTNYQASAGAKDHTILVATSRARPATGYVFRWRKIPVHQLCNVDRGCAANACTGQD
jgi:hypothetical protein